MKFTAMSNLSPQQKLILQWLLEQTSRAEQQFPELLETGFWWMPRWTQKTMVKEEDRMLENVWRASMCRSLARLEKRGLITRLRGRKEARTLRVMLTNEGRRVAEEMERY